MTIQAAIVSPNPLTETDPWAPRAMLAPSAMLWHSRFMAIAHQVASWSKDPSTKVGAVLVDDERRIVSTGYNGFPREIVDLPERLENRDWKYPATIHAELNSILTARESDLSGCTLYATHAPCARCTAAAIQKRIRHFVTMRPQGAFLERWTADLQIACELRSETRASLLMLDEGPDSNVAGAHVANAHVAGGGSPVGSSACCPHG